MLTCPQCQTVNPHDNKFCQGCGRSLSHHVCHACGGEVKFDAENCPQCHTISGTYRWAIIEQSQNQELTETIPSEIPILVDRVPDSVSLTLETDEDPWADPVAANELPIDRGAETVVVATQESAAKS